MTHPHLRLFQVLGLGGVEATTEHRGKALAVIHFAYTVPFPFPGLIAQSVEQPRKLSRLVLG
jgi:hypothetical protein